MMQYYQMLRICRVKLCGYPGAGNHVRESISDILRLYPKIFQVKLKETVNLISQANRSVG